ncbi:BAG domain-containing protein Samui-like isoform X1 [Pogonomyrmex barbatus]|uniref:BAG domain-containing protein Samui-like isoform X1 n=1 Tax=Pogonomyrmex barbatus TaxID=144034 RepID=A0A6I9W2L0_9HYME|nr:BAG domain-containing protein Samui-like isoform X1 [Pogonomyrmex barbatus]
MSFYSPRFADQLRGMSGDELLREMKQRFNEDNARDAFFESEGRPTRGDSFGDRPFSHLSRGFPFDDDTDVFERPRGDGIRAHLDDLAARHPEFAEHLRGPPWPFGGSLLRDRRRWRRDSGSNNNNDQQQQGQQHQDEDVRSQASGSSAASGASAVSSHSGGGSDGGEYNLTSSSAIPQYGLRNTVDIGQQQRRRDMEANLEKGERGQRSMSAPPPESWQQQGRDQQQSQPDQGQRFVSRVDITPQHNQQQQRAQSPSKPASNVRHIPIFVEGRDTPVIPKFAPDDVPSAFQQRQPSPPSSHHFERSSPPPHHFHRPSHFNERFSRQQWPPSHFQDAFYKPADFEQPMRRQFQQQQHQQPQYYYQQQQPKHHQQPQQQPQYYEQHYQQQQPQQQTQSQQQQSQPEEQQQQQESPKPKPSVPKDPLERVSQIQKDVDDLAEQVRRYVGGSRQDKEYIYLDEMLTRELIKLDDIETEGRENVRQARKNAIKSIQDTISLLETKALLANQQEQQAVAREEVQEECAGKDQQGEEISQVHEPMEVKQEKQNNEPIPLPPAPSASTKTKAVSSESESAATIVNSTNQSVATAGPQNTEQTADIAQKIEQKTENAAENIKRPVAPSLTDEATRRMDETCKISKSSEEKDGEQKDGMLEMTENKDVQSKEQVEKTGKMEVSEGGQRSSTESPRLQKKAKKTKKRKQQQQPVSEQPIPLPPPPTESAK